MSVRLVWIGGEHDFALDLGNLRAIQKYCDAGPHEILLRLNEKRWRVDDLFEVIRQGLIGGGLPSGDASRLVTAMMTRHPLIGFVVTAQAILAASLVGDEDDPVGEAEGAASPPANGASLNSTAPA